MRQVRTEIEIKQGVKVGMLFTPRLYMFKGRSGVDFIVDSEEVGAMYALYADIMYCAALNLWTLEGKNEEDAIFTRADFHEWMAIEPQAFGKALSFAFAAMTGKELNTFIDEQEKAQGSQGNAQNEVKKKTIPFLTKILRLFL
jgi:hypothetical protein